MSKKISDFHNQKYNISIESYVSEACNKAFKFGIDLSCDNYISLDNKRNTHYNNRLFVKSVGTLNTKHYKKRTLGEIKKVLITNNMNMVNESSPIEFAVHVLNYFICVALSEYSLCLNNGIGNTIEGLISYSNAYKSTRKDILLDILNNTNVNYKDDDGMYYLKDKSESYYPYSVVKEIIGLCCAIICDDTVLGF